ncbi:MAG TPA: triose-phosphate isomerase [Chloroflexota bacterium]|jgi:triosephosphate isomerase
MVAGNWKMNTTVAEAIALVEAMRVDLEAVVGVDRVLCPPFVSLAALHERLAESPVRLGAQNMYFEPKGAFTGEISPTMLAGLVDHVILGHSERRHIFGEDDTLINRKVQAAIAAGLRPILCVGETLAENEANRTHEVVSRQIREGLAGVADLAPVVMAYEPVWAIGTGRPATPEGANTVMGALRRLAGELYGAEAAAELRILYGGSVTTDNFAAFMGAPEIDGGLVGGASLNAQSFVTLVQQAAAARVLAGD